MFTDRQKTISVIMIRLSLLCLILVVTLPAFAAAQKPDKTRDKPVEIAYFAAGCFWCIEADFEKVDGVYEAVSGYMGGEIKDPSYERVASGNTQHYEAVKVRYNPEKLNYDDLLAVFWQNIDPYDDTGQFCDKGNQYRAAIFARNDDELQAARDSKKALQDAEITDRAIVTQIHLAKPFYKAEKYHQDYYKKNAIRYKFYRYNCGRDDRLNEIWGKADLREIIE